MPERDPICIRFGDRVRQLRTDAELSQEELAQRSGLHPTYISQVERGRRNPTLESMASIARGLSVDLGVLLTL